MGHGRSVCPEFSGPHASCNGRDNGIQHRKMKAILKPCLSWDRGLKPALVNHGIPSNRASSSRGEYVPAPCTHRPSFHSSGVWVRRSPWWLCRIQISQEGKSRNKVAVGEPAAGSPPKKLALHCQLEEKANQKPKPKYRLPLLI